jgi:DnaJ-domain-containing protein 1
MTQPERSDPAATTPADARFDPFEALGLAASYDIDEATLRRAWLRRSAALHPDRAGDTDEVHAAIARLNAAKATLADDERRANALLHRLGGPSKERSDALPDGFLVDIFAVREEMEEAIASGDPEDRARFERWAQEEREKFREAVASQFAALEAPPSPGALEEIRTQLNAWRYIERMIEQLDPNYEAPQRDTSS